MTYDFTSIARQAWHGFDRGRRTGHRPGFAPDPPREGFDVIPMWVADMNFPTVPTIPQAIIERAKHPAYGYFSPPTTITAPSSTGSPRATGSPD